MFSLFRKKKITIGSVTIPELGWLKVKSDENIIQWVNPQETIAVSINFFDLVPNLPTIKDVHVLRTFYRELVTDVDGGLIEVELYRLHQFDVIRTIFKIPQKPSGMTYIGSLTIPFKTCSFVLKIQAVEAGLTGIRDATIGNKFLQTGDFDLDKWSADPYDKEITTGALMNLSEVQAYDKDFPHHPLSR